MSVSSKTKLFLSYLPLVRMYQQDISKSVDFQHIEEIIKRFENPKNVDTSLPQPHIPIVGNAYDLANIKMAIYGMETRQWGDLVDVMKNDIRELIVSKDCDNWVNNLEYWNGRYNTFHAFVKRLLISLYDSEYEPETVARSIVYGQYYSYVRWEKIPFVENKLIKGDDSVKMQEYYSQLKEASNIFDGDSFQKINCLNPDIVLVLKWEPKMSFNGYELRKQYDHFKIFQSKDIEKRYILMIPHPRGFCSCKKNPEHFIQIIKTELLNIYKKEDFKFESNQETLSKQAFIGELANYISTHDTQYKISHSDIQMCLKYNGYLADKGIEYGNNGAGIKNLLKSSCKYYHDNGDSDTENNIIRHLL